MNNQYCLDKSVAFGWVHGTASFQLISNAVAYFMWHQVKLHCHIDDYVAALPRVKADTVFQNLYTLLNEICVHLNISKLINIDIDNNTLSISQAKVHVIRDECIKSSFKKYLIKRPF